jgi:hypothetical protein
MRRIMRTVARTAAGVLVLGIVDAAAAQRPVAPPPVSTPAAPAPAAPAGPVGELAPLAARTFSSPAGMIFNTVRADRVADFEKLVGYLQDALARSTDMTIREQAKGWRIFKAAEPGPAGSVLYVFLLDPTVPNAEYGLARIIADAYPNPTELREIWKLYTASVTGGGSLLSLSPVAIAPPPAPAGLKLEPAPAGPETLPRMLPPDRDPARP